MKPATLPDHRHDPPAGPQGRAAARRRQDPSLVEKRVTVTIVATHRIAGPLHRIEVSLRALVDGRDPGELRSRQSDELQELFAVVNQLRAQLHGQSAQESAGNELGELGDVESLAEPSGSESTTDAA